ncbi:hypothetical protein [Cyclobacterium roseum]|uniref:hypothetical protein n=1 Tax=Cyclobacterium roseum TaxID=2666137 RepID=UPI0013909215|nr:hypothetical protein [Cyclobacterium roseum]
MVLEIANEYPHGGYRGWPDSDWLVSEAGQVELMEGNSVTAPFPHLFQDTSVASRLVLRFNDNKIPVDNNQKKVVWEPEAAGPYYLRMLVYDEEGHRLYQSAPVDIEISPLVE